MRVKASVGRGAKKNDTLMTRVGILKLTAEIEALPFEEHHLLARLLRLIQNRGLRSVVEAAAAAVEDE